MNTLVLVFPVASVSLQVRTGVEAAGNLTSYLVTFAHLNILDTAIAQSDNKFIKAKSGPCESSTVSFHLLPQSTSLFGGSPFKPSAATSRQTVAY